MNELITNNILSDEEKKELSICEDIIKRGMNTFIAVGRALCRIKRDKLYRSEFKTFESYCSHRWSYSRSYCSRLMNAAKFVEMLPVPEMLPIGNKLAESIVPMSESVIRPLAKVKDAEMKKKIWTDVSSKAAAEGRGVKTEDVEDAVFEEIGEHEPETHATCKIEKPDVPQKNKGLNLKAKGIGLDYAADAIDCLKRIPLKDGFRKEAFEMVRDFINDTIQEIE